MGRPRSTYVGEDRRIESFGGEIWGKRDHLEDLGVDGRIILRRIFRKWDVVVWTGWSWLRIGIGGRHLCGEFLD